MITVNISLTIVRTDGVIYRPISRRGKRRPICPVCSEKFVQAKFKATRDMEEQQGRCLHCILRNPV